MVYNRVTVMQNNNVLAQFYIKVHILGTPEPTGLHKCPAPTVVFQVLLYIKIGCVVFLFVCVQS